MINIKNLPKSGSHIEYFTKGQIIICEGETKCDKMYILLRGSANIFKNYQESCELKITTLTEGDFFGEMSLFLNKARTATVVANENVTALAIDHGNAFDFFKNQPVAAYSLIQTLCSRLEKTNLNLTNNYVTYEQNLSSLHNEKSELETVARMDALTGIYNRRYFMQAAQALSNESLSENKNVFIIIFDLDHFKNVNDTYGHQAGDKVLKAVADSITCSLRPNDIFARYGGEEFVLLITDLNEDEAVEFIERIRQNIHSSPVEFEEIYIPVSASFGIAGMSRGMDIDEAIALADMALYKAKQNGRNRTIFYSEFI